MQALIGEPVTVLQTAALAGAYLLYKRPGAKRIAILGVMFIAGFLIAAVQIVPAFDHARDSVRAEGFTYPRRLELVDAAEALIEVAYPQIYRALRGPDGEQATRTMYAGRIEPYISDIYAGLLVVSLVLAGLLRGVRGRWLVLAIVLVSDARRARLVWPAVRETLRLASPVVGALSGEVPPRPASSR